VQERKTDPAAPMYTSRQYRCASILDTSAWDWHIGYGHIWSWKLGRFATLGQQYKQHYLGQLTTKLLVTRPFQSNTDCCLYWGGGAGGEPLTKFSAVQTFCVEGTAHAAKH